MAGRGEYSRELVNHVVQRCIKVRASFGEWSVQRAIDSRGKYLNFSPFGSMVLQRAVPRNGLSIRKLRVRSEEIVYIGFARTVDAFCLEPSLKLGRSIAVGFGKSLDVRDQLAGCCRVGP